MGREGTLIFLRAFFPSFPSATWERERSREKPATFLSQLIDTDVFITLEKRKKSISTIDA
jgi:hypothetical protein